ncbi:DnaJ domain-containing protein [bacterium]|nr:DnaJ domain-containing protein [bacterium]
MKYKDYYNILGVDRKSTKEDIQKAYRKLARTYHPDVNKAPDAEARFKEIGEAYAVLSDPLKRRRFDSLGANWNMGEDFTPPPGFGGHGGRQGGRVEFDFGGPGGSFNSSDFSDFFESIFGGLAGGKGARQRAGTQKRPQKSDHEVELSISLEEAFHGSKRRLTMTVGAPGQQKKRTIEIKIPEGVRDGSKIRIPNQVESGIEGVPAGDLILKFHFEPHQIFNVDGYNLYVILPLTPVEAVLGGKIPVATMEGTARVTVKPGTQSGHKLRLSGQGLPKKGGSRGDLIVETLIVIPESISEPERQLWEQISEKSDFNPRKW